VVQRREEALRKIRELSPLGALRKEKVEGDSGKLLQRGNNRRGISENQRRGAKKAKLRGEHGGGGGELRNYGQGMQEGKDTRGVGTVSQKVQRRKTEEGDVALEEWKLSLPTSGKRTGGILYKDTT